MSKQNEHHDTYTIPPNFIEGGTLFGGMFKIRNVIEAGIIAFAVGMPVFSIDISLLRLTYTGGTAGRCRGPLSGPRRPYPGNPGRSARCSEQSSSSPLPPGHGW